MSPAFQGLDRAVAPPPATAKKMLDTIDGRWWNVYIGGPESGGHGWSPDLVRQYARHGIDRFMLTYVGRQSRGPLTRAQGQTDGREALAIARSYGYSSDFPLCLDVELPTFTSAPSKTVEYARAWCATVRDGGARPGVYANPAPLMAMAKGKVPAAFVWIASWVSTSAGQRNPHHAQGMPANLWPRDGQRAWQYAGIINGRACNVLGLNVDINVADLGCLAPPPGRESGPAQVRPSRSRALRQGDRGAPVARLSRRLSVVRARRTGRPYLDGPRRRFDAETEAALEVFQADHRLVADGIYGPLTARALLKAVRREKDNQQLTHQGSPPRANGSGPAIEVSRLPELVREFRRLDDAADRAWQRLEEYGRRRGQLLTHVQAKPDRDPSLADITASLGRIEKQLGTLVALESRELALVDERVPVAQAVVAPAPEHEALDDEGPRRNGSSANGSNELSGRDLDRLIDALDRRLDDARRARIARYARADQALAPLAHSRTVKPKPEPNSHAGGAGDPKPRHVAPDKVRALQRSLNRFVERHLEGIAPLDVDGKKGPLTDSRIRAVKYYLGYGGAERKSASVKPPFVRRLQHPHSARASGPAMLARAARRRRKQRQAAKSAYSSPIEGTPKHIIDTIVLPIARDSGINRSPAENDAANARHGPTTSGGRSDHQGPPATAWAADISNGVSPTPEMDKLARRLATRFNIPWDGSGLVNAAHGGYRYQLIYRTYEGGNHFNHVHFGVRDI